MYGIKRKNGEAHINLLLLGIKASGYYLGQVEASCLYIK
jgi:hypothetical protein